MTVYYHCALKNLRARRLVTTERGISRLSENLL